MFAFYSSILVFSSEIQLFLWLIYFFPIASPGVWTLSPVGIGKEQTFSSLAEPWAMPQLLPGLPWDPETPFPRHG